MTKENHAASLVDATQGVIWKQLLRFFYPIALGTLFQLLYNMADAMIVGRFVGKFALAAVGGSVSTLLTLIVGLFTGLSSGATVVIAQLYGSGERDRVGKAVGASITLSLLFGLTLTAVGVWLAPAALAGMKTPADTMALSVRYMRICLLALTPVLLYNMGSGILRAVGDSRRPLIYLICCSFLNIGLDLLFVVVFHWGITGAALATAISQVLSAVLVLQALVRDKDCYHLSARNVRLHPPVAKSILRIGIPAGFQSCMYSISNIIIMTAVNALGTDFVAAWGATNKIDSIFWMLMNAFGLSLLTVVGQNFGAGDLGRVRRAIRSCLVIAFLTTLVTGAGMLLFSRPLMHLFVEDANVVRIGMEIMYFFVPSYFTYVCIEVFASSLRGMGDSLIPAVITTLGICVLRILWVTLIVPAVTLVPQWIAVCASYPVSWVLTSAAFLLYYPLRFRQAKARFANPQL